MPTNENTYNSRVTSEALEAKFRQVFPSQGGAELVDDLYASGVIQPVIDFSSVAEGSVLAQNLQTAWDFATGHDQNISTGAVNTNNLISTPGFWLFDLNATIFSSGGATVTAVIDINDGLGSKVIWEANSLSSTANQVTTWQNEQSVVFLRSGDTLRSTVGGNAAIDVVWRQIADVNGNLVNPLGFVFT